MSAPPDGRAVSPRSPSVATFLSFLWPGLGQWYAGHRLQAVLFALPVVVAFAALAYQLSGGVQAFAVSVLDPRVSLTLLVVIVFLGLWRLIAMIDAARAVAPPGERSRSRLAFVLPVLVAVVVAAHGVLGYFTWSTYAATSAIFSPGTASGFPPGPTRDPSLPTVAPDASTDPGASDPLETPRPGRSPQPSRRPQKPKPKPLGEERVNILLLGIDSGEGRDHALTDTLMLASVDPVKKTVAMISFPRDISEFPLWDGRIYKNRINSLMSYAYRHPDRFDGMTGLEVLTKEVGYLLGIEVDHYASIDLAGFEKMIDLVGGVDVDNPRDIDDPSYPGPTMGSAPVGFKLSAGKHHLDGATALKYVRTRKGHCDSDFTRAARQQQVLSALRARVQSPQVIPQIPAILQEAARTIRTNYPSDRIGALLQLAPEVPEDRIRKVVLSPPYSVNPPVTETDGRWILRLDMKRVAALSVSLFGEDSRYAEDAGTPQRSPKPLPTPVPGRCGG